MQPVRVTKPIFYYEPGQVQVLSQSHLVDSVQRRIALTRPHLTTFGRIMHDKKSVMDSAGGIHNSLAAWKRYMGLHRSHPIFYVDGVHQGIDVSTAREMDVFMAQSLIELSKYVHGDGTDQQCVLSQGNGGESCYYYTRVERESYEARLHQLRWWMTAPITEEE